LVIGNSVIADSKDRDSRESTAGRRPVVRRLLAGFFLPNISEGNDAVPGSGRLFMMNSSSSPNLLASTVQSERINAPCQFCAAWNLSSLANAKG
jgi:hypothetical protein